MAIDFQSLKSKLIDTCLLTDPVELLTYEVDAANDRGQPLAVAIPGCVNDVMQIVSWAAEKKIPLTARGAGTGLSGGAVSQGGMILEFSRLNQILEFDQDGRSAVVQPGVINLKLDELARKSGLYFPPDPASGRSATIGGNIAENAGGPHCFKYGVTTNYLTGLQVVLADGRIVSFGGRVVDPPEVDFVGILTGSEGTLGIVVEAVTRLLRNPPAVKAMMASFDTIERAGEAVSAIIAGGLVPATMEFMDQKIMRIVEEFVHAGLPVEASAALIIEVDGYQDSLDAQVDELVAILRANSAVEIRIAKSAEERDLIWYGRKSAAGAMARLVPAYYLLDGTVPRSKLATALRAINQVCDRLDLRVGYVFHAGDGNLHPFVLIEDPANSELMEHIHEAGKEIMQICVNHDGSITGEHGVGLEKREFLPLMYNSVELSAMQDLKQVFDPQGIMNPGKIFPDEECNHPSIFTHHQSPITNHQSREYYPQSDEEAAECITECRSSEHSLRLRGGSSQSGWLPIADCDMEISGMSGIRSCAPEDLYVTVGAGMRLSELQEALSKNGLWVPLLAPWKESTLGGLAATGLNSPLRMRYGGLRDLVLAARIVLPDGRLARFGRPVVKNVAGYDMTKLFIGSNGSLGLITELTIKLSRLPRKRLSLLASVPDLATGLDLGAILRQICLNASALLLFHGTDMRSSGPYSLLYSVEGHPQDVAAEIEQAQSLMEKNGASQILQRADLSGSQLWADWILSFTNTDQNGYDSVLLRLGIPVKALKSFMSGGSHMGNPGAIMEERAYIADLANGMVYLRGMDDLKALRQAAQPFSGYVVVQGTPVRVNLAAAGVNAWGYAPESQDLICGLKKHWDPQGLFNPGAFLI